MPEDSNQQYYSNIVQKAAGKIRLDWPEDESLPTVINGINLQDLHHNIEAVVKEYCDALFNDGHYIAGATANKIKKALKELSEFYQKAGMGDEGLESMMNYVSCQIPVAIHQVRKEIIRHFPSLKDKEDFSTLECVQSIENRLNLLHDMSPYSPN